jgi:ATP/maltotriose-dependent transcriptional regulator MalT
LSERLVRGLVAVGRGDPPGQFEPIVRGRLVSRFVQAAAHRVTLVVAPAGFGKSVAVQQFLEHAKGEHLKIVLRPESASVPGFLKAFAGLVGQARPKGSRDASSDAANRLAAFAAGYAGTIVVDNLHLAKADLAQLFVSVIERDHHARWILAGRGASEIPVASWLAYGISDMPIDHVDLRFNLEEARELVAARRLNLGGAEINELLALTDGWPTALGFALRARSRISDLPRAVAATREMVHDYLAEQVFGDLDPSDQKFLLDTALLPSLDLDVLGIADDDAANRVARLRRLTSFIASDSETQFHYHELFREFLEQQLRQRGVSRFREAAGTAAAILERSGNLEAALASYVQAQSWGEIVRLLRTSGFRLFDCDSIAQLEAALGALPAELRDEDPLVLALVADLCAFRGRFGEAEAFFGLSRRLAAPGTTRAIVGERWAAFLLRQGRFDEALAFLNSAFGDATVPPAVWTRVLATKATALAEAGSTSEAVATIAEALNAVTVLGDDALKAHVLCSASRCELVDGRFDAAKSHALAASRLAQHLGFPSLMARTNLMLYRIAREQGDDGERSWLLTQIGQSVAQGVDTATEREFFAVGYTASVESGNSEKIDAAQARLESDGRESRAGFQGVATGFALQSAWNAEFGLAQQVIAAELARSPKSQRLLHLSEQALYAAAAGDRETAEAAAKAFAEILQSSEAPRSRGGSEVMGRVLYALALVLMERSSSANNVLRDLEAGAARLSQPLRALAMAARAVYVHAETGAAHAELSARLADLGRSGLGGYARLIEALPLPTHASSPRFSALTKMELRVLHSLAAGETSRQVAGALGRSPQTVDSHVKSIIKKLGCSGRRQAIALARAQGLV